MILDIHSHRPFPYPEGVISLRDFQAPIESCQLYSAGIHPWDTEATIVEETFRQLELLAKNPQVAAIGEAGIDLTKGGPMFRQLQVFKKMVEISESVGKPLIIHAVKSADIILGLKREMKPAQPWIIHGFRGKPGLAQQYTEKGLFLSFGEKYNPEALKQTPQELLLAETDESSLTIGEIITCMSADFGTDVTPVIAANTAALLSS